MLPQAVPKCRSVALGTADELAMASGAGALRKCARADVATPARYRLPYASFVARGIGVALAILVFAACGGGDASDAVDVFPSCKPPPESCQELLHETFDEPYPGIPPASVGPLMLWSGEQTGKVFLWVYNGKFGEDERVVIAGVKKRSADGYEPPGDPAALTPTPAGRSVVLRAGPDGTVAGMDFWTASYHYAVSLQGTFDIADPVVGATLALVDALPESG